MKNIAVIMSGCGFLDGTEITEAVSALICLSELGAKYQCFAPDQEFPATDHLSSEPSKTSRNALVESARICRGDVKKISELTISEFDAVLFPGGFGAALNLSDWANKGAGASIMDDVKKIILQFHEQGKPIGGICIAPTLIAKALGDKKPCVTIGNDKATAEEIKKTGASHENCPVTDYITDRETKVVTTPAYMYGQASPFEVFTGIRGLVKELFEMA